MKLKNPWRTGEWKGDFSDKSSVWDTRLKQQLGLVDKEDGIFWMPFKDMVVHFAAITICKVFDSNCEKLSKTGQWTKETGGGCPN